MKDPNENRPGYKNTRVGWIPEEWTDSRLEELWQRAPQNGLYKEKDAYGRGWRMVHMSDLFANDIISDQEMKLVQLSEREKSNYALHDGDLLFGRRSLAVEGAGKCTLVQSPCDKLTFESSVIRVKPHLQRLWPRYGFHYIASPTGRYQMFTFTRVVSVAGIAGSDLKLYRLPIPSVPEQKKIAEILSRWDETIEQMRKLIAAKRRLEQALMQQLLTGKKRLRGFKDPWQPRKLGDLFTERIEVECQHLRLLAITGSRGIIPAEEIERKDSSNADKSRYKRIAPGDIGYNTMRMWQGVSALSSLEGIVSPAYTVCVPNVDVHAPFMAYFFKFKPTVHLFWRYSQGLVSDTLNLKFHNFAQISVDVPKETEQKAIAVVLQTADEEIAHLETTLQALQKQKRGLMQKLLTGTVRVKGLGTETR